MIRNLKIIQIVQLALLSITATSSYAVESIRAKPMDERIKEVAYERDNVVPIQASTFVTTQIMFGRDEVIENVQNGDLAAWSVSVEKGLPNMMYLKPTIEGSDTNMTVVTNEHVYYFHLNSDKHPNSTYAVEFTYPEQQKAVMQAKLVDLSARKQARLSSNHEPHQYNWDYSFHGSRTIMPLHVFDDGKFTYLQLRPRQAIPAVFAVDNKSGEESVVNYRREGQYIVVQQTAPQFTLRSGSHQVASIFNNQLIHKMRG